MKAITKKMLVQSGINAEKNPAIVALIEFATQRSGIEARNYFSDWRDGNGVRAFRQECRDIQADLRRFKEALHVAAAEGVTDADVIAEAPRAYSGRLEWKSHKAHIHRQTDPAKYGGTHKGGIVISEIDVWDWHYCTGQYFPTEYRKAAAVLLEYATRRVRQARPAATRKVGTIAELKALNAENGGCWFERSTMAFFGTRIESGILRGKYFVSSEQPPHGTRMYSLRKFDDKGNIGTVGEFCKHETRQAAIDSMPAAESEQAAA